jgi:uncharacterized protein (DUF2147 family)
MTHVRRSLLAACAVAFTVSPALAAEPYGNWVRPSNGAQVTFYDCGGRLCGKVASKGASSARVGTVIVSGAVKTGNGQWKGASRSIPITGKPTRASLRWKARTGLT